MGMVIIFFTAPIVGSFRCGEDKRSVWFRPCRFRLGHRWPYRGAPLFGRCWVGAQWATIIIRGCPLWCRNRGCFRTWWSRVAGSIRLLGCLSSIFRCWRESGKTSDCRHHGAWTVWARFPPSCLHWRPKRTCCFLLCVFCRPWHMRHMDRFCWPLI